MQILEIFKRFGCLAVVVAVVVDSCDCGNCQTFIYYGDQDLIVATATASAEPQGESLGNCPK